MSTQQGVTRGASRVDRDARLELSRGCWAPSGTVSVRGRWSVLGTCLRTSWSRDRGGWRGW